MKCKEHAVLLYIKMLLPDNSLLLSAATDSCNCTMTMWETRSWLQRCPTCPACR